jgi:hypothetical protein
MANKAPTLTPLPNTMIGIPQTNPARSKKIETGRKMRKGLNSITIFIISKTVSIAVFIRIVLFPAFRG